MFNTKYIKYNHINNNILKSSIEEINEKTDIKVIYTTKKDQKIKNQINEVIFDIINK